MSEFVEHYNHEHRHGGIGLHSPADVHYGLASALGNVPDTRKPPGQWHDRMEEKILADAIIDRITTNAHTTFLTCDDSMRKHFNQLD